MNATPCLCALRSGRVFRLRASRFGGLAGALAEAVRLAPDDMSVDPTPPIEEADDYGPEPVTAEERASTIVLVSRMTVPEKLAAAVRGTREMRSLLVQDPNRIVALAVLNSPKLSESEVENIARMSRVSEDVLRTIGQSRTWIKHYPIVIALVRNAKTPLGISLNLLPRLTARDLRFLSIDRNIPDPLRVTARRRVTEAQS